MLTLKLQTTPVSGIIYLENNSFQPPASLQHPHKVPLVDIMKKLWEENTFIKGQHGCHSAPKSKLKWAFPFSFLQHNEYPASPCPWNNNKASLYLMTGRQQEDGKCQLQHRNKANNGIYAWNNWRQESEDRTQAILLCVQVICFHFYLSLWLFFSTIALRAMLSIWVYMHLLHSLPLGKGCTLYWSSCMIIFLLLIWIPVSTHLICWLHVKM